MARRLFAVNIGGGWVEVREATSPPRRKSSSFLHSVEVPSPSYYVPPTDERGIWSVAQGEPKTKKVPIEVVIYVGGKVVETIKSATFIRRTDGDLYLPFKGMVEIPRRFWTKFKVTGDSDD